MAPQVATGDSDLQRCDRWSLVGDCRRTVETFTSCGAQAHTHTHSNTSIYIYIHISRFTFHISRFTRFTFHVSQVSHTHRAIVFRCLGEGRHSRCSGSNAARACCFALVLRLFCVCFAFKPFAEVHLAHDGDTGAVRLRQTRCVVVTAASRFCCVIRTHLRTHMESV